MRSQDAAPRNTGGAASSSHAPTPKGVLSNRMRWHKVKDEPEEPQAGADDGEEWDNYFSVQPSSTQKLSFYNVFGTRKREPSRSPSPRHVPLQAPTAENTVTNLVIAPGVEVPPRRPLNLPGGSESLPKRRAVAKTEDEEPTEAPK